MDNQQRSRRRDKNNREVSSGADSDNNSVGDNSQGTVGESTWITSDLNSDCLTNLRIISPNSNSISLQDKAPVTLESGVSQHFGGGGGVVDLIKPTLLDTGAWLSYVTLSFASRL